METKQVIIIRKDLNMRKGKMVAQGAHASLTVCLELRGDWDPDFGYHESARGGLFKTWLETGQTKICVSVNSEQELLDVYNSAKQRGIPCSLVRDAGRTEFAGVATLTACAIGPDESAKIDLITGDLLLL